MRRVACLVLVAVGCSHPAGGRPRPPAAVAACQAWPASYRYGLQVGGDGALYWIERQTAFGYTRAETDWLLMRWDRTTPPRPLTRRVLAPFRVLDDGRAVGLYDGVVDLWDDGQVWLLSSGDHAAEYLDLSGEPDTILYRAGGDLYRQRLGLEVATWVGQADALIGVAGTTAYVRRGDALLALDSAAPGRPARRLPGTLTGVSAVRGDTVITTSERGIEAWPLAGGPTAMVVAGADWHTFYTSAGVAAWRKAGDGIEAVVVAGREPVRLPRITGVDAVDSFVRLPDGTAAFLIPHDTDRDGELTVADETDLCLVGPGRPGLAVTARDLPARHRDRGAAVEQAVHGAVAGAVWGFNGGTEVPGVWVRSPAPLTDRAARVDLVAELAGAVTAAAGDPTLDLYLSDGDGRRATSEWQPWSHHRLRFVGHGRALSVVPDDAEAIVTVERMERSAGRLECAGSITNQSDRPLVRVEIECTDGGPHLPLAPAELAPGATGRFAGWSPAGDGEDGVVVRADRRAVLAIQPARLQEQLVRTAAAEDAFDRSRLTVWGWKVEEQRLVLEVSAPDDFGRWSHTSREMAAATGLAALTRPGPEAYGAPAGAAAALRIRAGDRSWWFDGELSEIE